MITEKDKEVISHLRKDGRRKVTEISREMSLPATTIYDKLRSQKKKGIIKRHVTLLDYAKMGYHATSIVAFKTDNNKRHQLEDYLRNHPNVNTLHRVDLSHSFIAELIFEDHTKMYDFLDETESKFNMEKPLIFNIIQEIKKEEFLSKI